MWVHAELVQAGVEPGYEPSWQVRLALLEPTLQLSLRYGECILRAYRERLPASGIHFGWGWPDGSEHMHRDEICRRQDDEIPPPPDGERW